MAIVCRFNSENASSGTRRGAAIVEMALILAVIVAAGLLMIAALGDSANQTFALLNGKMTGQSSAQAPVKAGSQQSTDEQAEIDSTGAPLRAIGVSVAA